MPEPTPPSHSRLSLENSGFSLDDWAPGDRWVPERDWSELSIHTVTNARDPLFQQGYERLYATFSSGGGIEGRSVLEDRLQWSPTSERGGARLLYEMQILRMHGHTIAIRDHNVIIRHPADTDPAGVAVTVHLSHAWVDPAHRARGLGAWLRTLPIGAARRALERTEILSPVPVTLVAEMEHPDPSDPLSLQRLRTYANAGFRLLDPERAMYAQPDFRSASDIARTQPEPVPLMLVLRRVGRESESEMPSSEVRALIDALYSMYAQHVPKEAIAPLRSAAERWTSGDQPFELRDPTPA